jgi:hypothetical protein
MLVGLALSIAHLTAVASAQVQHKTSNICWIDRVEALESGVRVHFKENGSPAAASAYPDGKELEIGSSFSIGNSGHDGCLITARYNDDLVGVEAKAWFLPKMMAVNEEGDLVWAKNEMQVRTEWIAAQLPR